MNALNWLGALDHVGFSALRLLVAILWQSSILLIAIARVHNRPLTDQEIIAEYKELAGSFGKDTSLFTKPDVTVQTLPEPGRIAVYAEYALMSPLPQGASIEAALYRGDADRSVIAQKQAIRPGSSKAALALDAGEVPPGAYRLRVVVTDAQDRPVGEPAVEAVQWAGQSELFKGVKILNNICWELLNEEPGALKGTKSYTFTQPSEAQAWRFLEYMLINAARSYREKCPGSLPRLSVCFGNFSIPPEFLNTFPHVDYRTYLEMQFNLAATHPAFQDIGGLMTYLASYADREIVRWGATLFRHYGIEGRTDMLSTDPYILPHIENGDFALEGKGWTLRPAEEDGIRFGHSRGFGWLQGRYPLTVEGDTVIITRRNARGPNRFSQVIKDLEPGRLYTFRMYTGDFNDLSKKVSYGMSLDIDGVETLESFTHINANCYSHKHGPYDRVNKAWMNYHYRIFRAKAPTATLTVSDWKTEKEPGGPVGQELMHNFVQVQPYNPPAKEGN